MGEDTCLDLLSGLLPPAERESVLSHARDCANCAEFVRDRIAERERLRASWRLGSSVNGVLVLERPEEVGAEASIATAAHVASGSYLMCGDPGTSPPRLRRWLRNIPAFRSGIGAGLIAALIAVCTVQPEGDAPIDHPDSTLQLDVPLLDGARSVGFWKSQIEVAADYDNDGLVDLYLYDGGDLDARSDRDGAADEGSPQFAQQNWQSPPSQTSSPI